MRIDRPLRDDRDPWWDVFDGQLAARRWARRRRVAKTARRDPSFLDGQDGGQLGRVQRVPQGRLRLEPDERRGPRQERGTRSPAPRRRIPTRRAASVERATPPSASVATRK